MGQPIVRQVSWTAAALQLLFMGLLAVLYSLTVELLCAVFYGAATYLTLSVLLRFTVSRSHRKGITFFKAGKYQDAIFEYRSSYDFFSRHPLVDKLRFITLLSASRISYTEMALLNIAFCYSQLGDVVAMKLYYQKAAEEFQSSETAKQALRVISAVEEQRLR